MIDSLPPIPPALTDFVPQLKLQAEDLKRMRTLIDRRLRDLASLIESLERVTQDQPAPREAVVLVRDNQFARKSVPDAVKEVMLNNPRAFRAGELTDILYRGGQGSNRDLIRASVGSAMGYWRGKRWLEKSDTDSQSWQFTAEAREILSEGATFKFEDNMSASR